MSTAERLDELGPSCPRCGGDTHKSCAAGADPGEQTDGLFAEVAWTCYRCGHSFEDELLERRNAAGRASAYRLRSLARQLMRSSHARYES